MPPTRRGESSFVGWVSQLPVVGVSSKRKVSQMLTSEVLNRAADLIEERGWGQGPMTWQGDGALCLEGGIAAAMDGKVAAPSAQLLDCPAYRSVRDYLDDRFAFPNSQHSGGSLWDWNDEYDRTADEVVEVLRAAAAIEQARESQPSVVQS